MWDLQHTLSRRERQLVRRITYDQILFVEDQSVLSQPSQAILAPCDNTPCDNVENSSDNNCESRIEVSDVDCSHIDQNLNENHDIEQSSESDPSVRMSRFYGVELGLKSTFRNESYGLRLTQIIDFG